MNTELLDPPRIEPAAGAGTLEPSFLHVPLYERLANHLPTEQERQAAADFLHGVIAETSADADGLPDNPEHLTDWMRANVEKVHAQYQAYLAERKAGAARRYFGNRAHALYFLRNVAPTKLVDGSWLYGLCAHAGNSRMSDLVTTYVEELGDGMADKNHVKLYRELLARYGLDPVEDLPDDLYRQGLVQLALGWNAQQFLPEIVGFNLGYEQLPLHLLITAYELNELGLDPYYFTLHVTVDNADSGHAQRAVQAVLDNLPRLGGPEAGAEFWRRVRNGFKLSNAGVGTTQVIDGFDTEREVIALLARKSAAGTGAHSDYCRVAGRSINDWLARPGGMGAFVAALAQAGWVKRGEPAERSRFWKLLQGEKAEMFGVFASHELQLIHDWLRGDASADGQAWDEPALAPGQRRPGYRALAKRAERQAGAPAAEPALASPAEQAPTADSDLQALQAQLAGASSASERQRLLHAAMAPAVHWTPAGLQATRLFLGRA